MIYTVYTPMGYFESRRPFMNTEEICPCRKTKHRTDGEMRALLNRLSRIEGQVRGVRGMVERDAYCVDILTQVAAVTAALNAFSRELLADHIRTCVASDLREGKNETVEELTEVLHKMMK